MDDAVLTFDAKSGTLLEQRTLQRALTPRDIANELRMIQDEMQMLQQRYQQLQAVGSYKLPSDGM